MPDTPVTTISISPLRRWFALGAFVALGGFVVMLSFESNVAMEWKALTLAIAGGVFWLAYRMYLATQYAIELVDGVLRLSNGVVITQLDNIIAIDRGMFALKPTNGFTILLDQPVPRGWAPGLYWSLGRRIGIGGVVDPAAAKFMAETLTAHVASRKRS